MARPRTNPRSALGERLAAAIDWSGLETPLAFREATNTSPSVYRSADIGAGSTRVDSIESWAKVLSVRPEWLAFGGPYPAQGRGECCVMILRRLPEAWLTIGRFQEIHDRGNLSNPTVDEWANIVQMWCDYTQSDLPLLSAELVQIREDYADDDLSRTIKFYPGLAEFLGSMVDDPNGPTKEEKATLRKIQFPDGVPAPEEVFRILWLAMRAKAERKWL